MPSRFSRRRIFLKPRPWSPEMEAALAKYWRAGESGDFIAHKLGVSPQSVYGKRKRMKLAKRCIVPVEEWKRGRHPKIDMRAMRILEDPRDIPGETLNNWETRLAAVPASMTAFLMGDPLPGYSALDRRGGAA